MLLIKLIDKSKSGVIYFKPTDVFIVRGYDACTDKPYVTVRFRKSYSDKMLTIYGLTLDAFDTTMSLIDNKEAAPIYTLEKEFMSHVGK